MLNNNLNLDKKYIISNHKSDGSGGLFGKPKPKSYTTPPDSGRSIAYGQVIELICSGGKYGIQGLKTDGDIKKAVYIDDTAIVSEDNTENFKGISIYERKGTSFQLPITEFNAEIVSEESVSVEVKANNPVTRAFINENITALRIRLSFVLSKNKKDGNNVVGTEATEVRFKVYIKEGNGAFVQRAEILVKGKYSEPYEKIWFYTVNPNESEFYVRIERVTIADTEDFKRVIVWQSYSIITETVLPFKRIAYAGIRFNTEDFGTSIPERRYRIGAMLLDIPTNATIQPDGGLLYSGNWNGLFKAELSQGCCDYSAIIWYLLTDEIDGVGDEIKPFMIDRFSLFALSVYNNELIPDGYGGFERRYLFNGVISKQNDGWKVIDSILSGCNARKVWENGTLKFVQDRPEPIFLAISNADVEEGLFSYSSIDVREVSTAVQVTWTDTTTGKTRQKYVSDAQKIAEYGYFLKQIESVGCHRLSQAVRIGRSTIFNECEETEIISFSCRGFATHIPVGKVIAIADSHIFNKRLAGLVMPTSTTNNIKLDYPVQINQVSGFDEKFYLLLYPDVREAIRNGSISDAYQHYVQFGQSENRYQNGYLLMCLMPNVTLEIKRVVNLPGVYTNLTVETPYSQIPEPESTFVLISPELPLKLYRVESKEVDESNIDILSFTCKEYNEYKWDKIERGLNLGARIAQVLPPSAPTIPTNINIVSFFNGGIYTIDVSWQIPKNADGTTNNFVTKYFVGVRLVSDTDFGADTQTNINQFTYTTTIIEDYIFRVRAETFNNLSSDYLYSDAFTVSISSNNTFVQAIFLLDEELG